MSAVTSHSASAFRGRYQLADLTLVGGQPWFAVHVQDEGGHTSSWLISSELKNDRFHFQAEAWVPNAIQALIGDGDGQVWAITCEDELVTNAALDEPTGWQPLAPHPQLNVRRAWYWKKLRYVAPDGERSELAGCLCWLNGDLLIGTFKRRLYRWEAGNSAVLEYEDTPVDTLGGINDIVITARAVYALGYAGLILRRVRDGVWQRVPGPWPEEANAFVNLIAGVEGPQGDLLAVAAGGSVVSVAGEVVRTVAQVPAEPLGITRFQRQWYVSTLDGCYELPGNGSVVPIKRNALMGKSIDGGACLIAFDAEPQIPGSAAIHIWLHTRGHDRWFREVVCRP